jgi:sporulation protein YlmC with PRC-barrel domain
MNHVQIAIVIVAAAASTAALSQQSTTPPPVATSPPAVNSMTSQTAAGQWRASKLVGLNVYDTQNAKVGDIEDVLIEPSGKVAGAVIGVGGFLGIGEHAVLIPFDQIKFMNEPASRTTTTATAPTTTTTTPPAATTDNAGRPTVTEINGNARKGNEKWWPDHAVISATKDQLKSMTQFKYN